MDHPEDDLTKQEELDEDDQQAEEEEGTERCPVCDRRNKNGEGDSCSHYFGLAWGSEIIWSDGFRGFNQAWRELTDVYSELEKLGVDARRACEKVSTRREIDCGFLYAKQPIVDPNEFNAASALQEVVAFSEGVSYSTTGMLGGSGSSLYLEDTSWVAELSERLRAFVAAVREDIKAGVISREEDTDDETDAVGWTAPWPPYPYVVVRFTPAVYGCRLLRFACDDDDEQNCSLPIIEIPFVGEARGAKGKLKKAAVEAAVAELKRLGDKCELRMCLVLSSRKAIYVGAHAERSVDAPPSGGVRMDHLRPDLE